ncbi:AP-3 complex subunit beta [Microbotryomycetes sp. JL201]|nr:AP-3 complex subunit beta [Microbotryomycetes sp. JL201]
MAALDSLKLNAARLGARLSENLAEHSRDLGLIDSFASGSGGGSGKYLESGAVVTNAGIEETKKMLASKREAERMEGLKRVVAMMTKNLPVTSFFPLVTSLLSPSTPLQARSLISAYIVHCAATAPELALLSINAYQKDLSDPNPIIRAGAIKTLALMNLDDIRELVGLAVSKGARDGSWYVRRASADATISLWTSDSTASNFDSLLPALVVLLDNASPLTIGAALSAWETLCPNRWDLIHQNYRKWCKILVDVEEWGQCVVMRVLLRYGRTFFVDPAINDGKVDPDAELLLKASEILLQHINPAVTSAAIKVQYYLGPADRHRTIVKPLLRLMRTTEEVQTFALEECAAIAQSRPDLFVDYVPTFLVRFTDSLASKQVRLRILVALATEANINMILTELFAYVNDSEESFSAEVITAIGKCARRVPEAMDKCLKALVRLSSSKSDMIVSRSILVLRSLLSSTQFPLIVSRLQIIEKLVALLHENKIGQPAARASIYWLVGQFAEDGLLDTIAPDTVRVGAKNFAQESDAAKLQLLTLSAKLVVLSASSPLQPNLTTLSMLFTYLVTLGRYDLVYEVRDRARFLKGLVEQAQTGQAHGEANMTLNEEDFKRGVSIEDLTGSSALAAQHGANHIGLSGRDLRRILFEGKTKAHGQEVAESATELGTFALALPTRRLLFSSSSSSSALPPYATTRVAPSSIRDPPTLQMSNGSGETAAAERSSTPLRGFGSDSFPVGSELLSSRSGRASPVVLVPSNLSGESPDPAAGSRSRGSRGRGYVDLDDFLDDDEGETESEEDTEEEEGNDEDDDSGQEEESGETETDTGEDEDESEKEPEIEQQRH